MPTDQQGTTPEPVTSVPTEPQTDSVGAESTADFTPPPGGVTDDTTADLQDEGATQLMGQVIDLMEPALRFLQDGGPTIWAIAALSVLTVALILWKVWRLALMGAWSRGKARNAVLAYEAGKMAEARACVAGRRGLRSRCIRAALNAHETFNEDAAREDARRFALGEISRASAGLRPLELIATIAPLLGLLGTVLGMISAFQALQEAGARADPATLAGGIWEALLTTAAGMAVAIPASVALAWFEGIVDNMAADVEDGVTRIFVTDHRKIEVVKLAAE